MGGEAGEHVVDGTGARRLTMVGSRSRLTWPGKHLGLSCRESQVLALVVEGETNKSIARRLFLGTETVKTYLSSIYRKLGVRGRAQAVAVVLRAGLYGSGGPANDLGPQD
jgi:DNA-binding NarL/FixJ family response regulator